MTFINFVKAGDKVLFNGVMGAIGSAALQLLEYLDAKVTAVGNVSIRMLRIRGFT